MGISNDQIYQAIMDLKADVGGLQTGLERNEAHTLAVSRKADDIRDELNGHKESSGAHGIEAERRGRSAMTSGLGAVFGSAVAAITIIKFLGWGPRP